MHDAENKHETESQMERKKVQNPPVPPVEKGVKIDWFLTVSCVLRLKSSPSVFTISALEIAPAGHMASALDLM